MKGAIHIVCNEVFLHAIVNVGHLDYIIFLFSFLRDGFGFAWGTLKWKWFIKSITSVSHVSEPHYLLIKLLGLLKGNKEKLKNGQDWPISVLLNQEYSKILRSVH